MQNSHLKNSLIAAGIAVFAGVVTLGANVAFGVTNPAQAPATAGLIGPTFSELDVRGLLNANGKISRAENTDVGTLTYNAGGQMITSSTGAVTFDDPEGITVLNGGLTVAKSLISKGLLVNGVSNLWSAVYAHNGLSTPIITGTTLEPIVIDHAISVSDNANFSKNLVVNGTTLLQRALTIISPLAFDPMVNNLGNGGLLTLKRDKLSNKGLHMDDNSIMTYGGPLFLNYYDSQNVVVGAPAGSIKFDVNGYIQSSKGFISQGNVIVDVGNPGAGNTTPVAPLSFANIVGQKVSFYDGNNDRYGVDVQSSELRLYSGAGGNSTGGITFGKSNETTFTEAMRIRNDGNVGIGTTTPNAKLDVSNLGRFLEVASATWPTSGSGLEAYAIADSIPANQPGGHVQSYNRGSSTWRNTYIDGAKVIINSNSNGNVGIGTTTPNAKLQVNGKVTASGFGTYHPRKASSIITIPVGSFANANIACDGTDTLISCSTNTYTDAGGTTDASDVSLSMLLYGADSKTCWARARNNSDALRYIRVFATCYSPGS